MWRHSIVWSLFAQVSWNSPLALAAANPGRHGVLILADEFPAAIVSSLFCPTCSAARAARMLDGC